MRFNKSEHEDAARSSRREFVAAGGAAMAGLGLAGKAVANPARISLAMDGGPKTVTVPDAEYSALTKWPRLGQAEKDAIGGLIDRNRYYDELPRLEKDWRAYFGAKYVKSHFNCTSALTSMFFALDLPKGSEIMVPTYTFFATVAPMWLFGYVPIFVDSDPETCCFDLADAKRKLTKRTRAMAPMHAWGLPCEMDHILEFGKQHGVVVLEDAAQAVGASMQGKKMGMWGEVGTFSMQASKVLPSIEGGMAIYRTERLYERAAAYGHYKAPPTFPESSPYHKYGGTGFGQKLRMHPFAAAVARTQLAIHDERSALVRAHVGRVNQRLLELPGLSEPRRRPDQERVYYSGNMVFLDEAKAGFSRNALVKALRAEGVRARTWDYPLQHRFQMYSEAKWWHHAPEIPESMPGAEEVNRKHIFLPLLYEEHRELEDQTVKAFEKIWANRDKLVIG